LHLPGADIDDMSGEYIASAVELLCEAGSLNVTLMQTVMKRGRSDVRFEVLCRSAGASRLQDLTLRESSTIGVRRSSVSRRALPRTAGSVDVFGHAVAVKTVQLPGGGERSKAEYEDVRRVARETGRTTADVLAAIAKETD
jgi:pyridinium-3,5-bisthiocarboxylic acid mononucleotide nickel chelatase